MDKDLFRFYYSIYEDITNGMEQTKYAYMENESYFSQFVDQINHRDISESQRIYWKEMLLRAHFATTTSIIRAKKWLYGVLVGVEVNNLMVFSSSLRGYLESVVDTYYSLQSIPTGLALNYKKIKAALDGKMNCIFLSNELESKLLHFQYASKDKEQPKDKRALTSTEYINSFDLDKIGIKQLYSELCEITHPASRSVNCFVKEVIVSEIYSYSIIDEKGDVDYIEKILKTYAEQIKLLMKMDVSLNGICLKVLNLFECEDVYTKYINESIFAKMVSDKSWSEILEMAEKGDDYLAEHNMEKVILW